MEGNLFVGNVLGVCVWEREGEVLVLGDQGDYLFLLFFLFLVNTLSLNSPPLLPFFWGWCWWIKVMTCSYLFFFFFFLISTLLLNSRPLPFFCSLSFLLHLLQVRVTVKQMIHLNSELYALQFQVFLLIPSYV